MTATERFLKYIGYHTTSAEDESQSPSTARQLQLTRALAEEMEALGLRDVHVDACGNALGTLPATPGVSAPVLALLAHVDTSPDASGENVRARIVRYEGGELPLGHGAVLTPARFPALEGLAGQELIVTDGSTLLGADDKAGVAEIMTMAQRLLEEGVPHGELRLIFTTDEEVGRGTEGLDVKALGCDYGYTVDGGELGTYDWENFNAASARVSIRGVSIHPGSAKGVMVNAAALATQFQDLLPKDQVPERTAGYEGFIHLCSIRGDVSSAELDYILRDHDRALLEEKKAVLEKAAGRMNAIYGPDTVQVQTQDTYYNMREKLEPHRHLLQRIEAAFAAEGIQARPQAIRGGTDGAQLSWEGLPCPNLSTGGYNFHGVYEFIPVRSLEVMVSVLCRLAAGFAVPHEGTGAG